MTPPTEVEVGELLVAAQKPSHQLSATGLAVLRRLAFDRDRLKEELRLARREYRVGDRIELQHVRFDEYLFHLSNDSTIWVARAGATRFGDACSGALVVYQVVGGDINCPTANSKPVALYEVVEIVEIRRGRGVQCSSTS
jgi:hypothetical protein